MTNMKILSKTKHRPELGDIFAFQILDGKYHWGRVVSLTATVGGFDDCILVYIYKMHTEDCDVPPSLSVEDLLLPPIATNELAWKKGYFKQITNCILDESDLLKIHCFKSVLRGICFDDKGNRLDRPYEPCGINGLDSYRTIDDQVSEALGIPLAPD